MGDRMTTLDDLARVERAIRVAAPAIGWEFGADLLGHADTIAAYIAAQRARDLVANLSAELSHVTQKGHANG